MAVHDFGVRRNQNQNQHQPFDVLRGLQMRDWKTGRVWRHLAYMRGPTLMEHFCFPVRTTKKARLALWHQVNYPDRGCKASNQHFLVYGVVWPDGVAGHVSVDEANFNRSGAFHVTMYSGNVSVGVGVGIGSSSSSRHTPGASATIPRYTHDCSRFFRLSLEGGVVGAVARKAGHAAEGGVMRTRHQQHRPGKAPCNKHMDARIEALKEAFLSYMAHVFQWSL
jgi:hypothetical protein